jgi:nucleosome binding factor SPN SPT16 subunit
MEEFKKLIKAHPLSHRWKKFTKYLKTLDKNLDGLLICNGDDDLESIKIKILAIQSYLFRFEFINSTLVVLPTKIIFFSHRQKIALIKEYVLEEGQSITEISFDGKEPTSVDFDSFLRILKESNVRNLGFFEKEKPVGFFNENFLTKIKNITNLTDVSKEVQEFLAVKEPKELELIRASSKLTCSFFRKLIEDVEEVVDSGEKVLHSKISDQVDTFMEKAKKKPNKWKLNGFYYDFVYAPKIQSNRTYTTKLTSGNSNETLSSDCIILNLCGKYYELNSLLVRTLLVNPTPTDKKNYQALKYLHSKVISNLTIGRELCEVYQKTKASFAKRYPELQDKLPASFGFGIGYEFKERCLNINHKNKKVIKENHVFAVVTSLKNLKGFKSNKEYLMQLADTVIVTPNTCDIITDKISKNIEEIGYDFEEESDEENSKRAENGKLQEHDNYMESKLKLLNEKSNQFEGKRMTRAALQREKILNDNRRKKERVKHQRELLDAKMKEIEERFNNGTFINKNSIAKKMIVKDIKLYNQTNFPPHLKLDEVRTDMKKWCILLPINDRVVPFHIALLKNVVKQSDGEFSRVRFNFFHPGVAVPTLEFPVAESLPDETIYLQELTYRSMNHETISSLTKRIKDLRKKWTLRDDTVEGANRMVELGSRLAVLHDLKMRPTLAGKKTKGTLSAYTRGYKFVSKKNNVFELPHSNIKHAIFQPCDENMMIILHFKLHKPILVNKKKTQDVQFYCEVGAIAEDLNDPRRNRNRFDYPNEMQEEEMERYMQQKYNDAFLSFVEKVNTNAQDCVQFESPFSEYSFYGSPYYNNVLISPCDRCLVSIINTPLFVLSLDDIEIVSIERIDNKIKNFDMIIIFKDYSKSVQSISNIPKSDLEKIRHWLDSKNILFFEGGKINLKWDNILKRIRENGRDFIFEEGGWRGFFDDDDDEALQAEKKNEDFDEESSFNEEDFDEDEEEAYEDDAYLEQLDQDDEDDEEDEEEYFDEDDEISVTEEEEEIQVKKKKKKNKKKKSRHR